MLVKASRPRRRSIGMHKRANCWAVFLVIVAPAFGASDEAAIQSMFVKPWIEAVRSNDRARMEQLFHPLVRACINASTKPFFDFVLDNEAHSGGAGPYKVTKISPLQGPPPALLPGDGFPYPVEPTYEVQIEFEKSNLISIHFLALSNGSWFEAFPCPSEKGMAFMRQKSAEGAEHEKKAAQLLADLKDPLRSELKDLLRQQRKIDAIQKYQAASSMDLTTAVAVINALQKSNQ
jgi:hypothetical protein